MNAQFDGAGKFRPHDRDKQPRQPDVRRLTRSASFMEDERKRFRKQVKEISKNIDQLGSRRDFYGSLEDIYDEIDLLINLLRYQSPFTTAESDQEAIADIAKLRDQLARKRAVIAPHSRFTFTSSREDDSATDDDTGRTHHQRTTRAYEYGGSSRQQDPIRIETSQEPIFERQSYLRSGASDASLRQHQLPIQGINGDKFEKISYGEFYGERLEDSEGWKSHYRPPRATQGEELRWKPPNHRNPNRYGEEVSDELVLHPGYSDFQAIFRSLFPNSQSRISCKIFMDRTIPDFVGSELIPGYETSLPKLVVFCGSIYKIWATTCEEFVTGRWPAYAADILQVFKLLAQLRLAPENQKLSFRIPTGTLHDGENTTNCVGRIDDFGKPTQYYLHITSRSPDVADFFEAVAWLSTVMQSTTDGAFFSASSITYEKQLEGGIFHLSNHYNASITKYCSRWRSNCWLPLVPNNPISADFGSRPRPRGVNGLEVSFELMCYLCGLEYYIVEDGGVVLYGSRSFVYPVRQVDDCVEWHFQPLEDEKASENPGSWMKVDDLATVCELKRHFIGLWADPRVTLGTGFSDVSKIAWSQATNMPREMISDGRSIGGIFTLPKFFGFSWAESFKVGRTRKNIFIAESIDFETKIHELMDVPVVLYCASERRAWMVSYLSVLLHLARSRAHVQRGLGYSIPPCALSANGGRAAFELILQCYENPLKTPAPNEVLRDRDRTFTIEKYLNIVIAGMECLKREKSKARGLFRSRIMGYDMAALAGCRHEAPMKMQEMEPFSHGWTPLLAQVELVLLCEGIFDPIVSSRDQQLNRDCLGGRWPRVPVGFNILTASLPCLKRACERFNTGQSMASINREYLWHNPGHSRRVFEVCCHLPRFCNKLQELRSVRSTQLEWQAEARRPSDSDLQNNSSGAVIFRYSDDLETIERHLQDRQLQITRFPLRTGPGLEVPRDIDAGNGRSDSGYSSTDQHMPVVVVQTPPRPRLTQTPAVEDETMNAVYPPRREEPFNRAGWNTEPQLAAVRGTGRSPQVQPRAERRNGEHARRTRGGSWAGLSESESRTVEETETVWELCYSMTSVVIWLDRWLLCRRNTFGGIWRANFRNFCLCLAEEFRLMTRS